MQEDISFAEFISLLPGLSSKTALGRVVAIRSEKDRKRLLKMDSQSLEIRREWQRFLAKNKGDYDISNWQKDIEHIQAALAAAF